MLARYRYRVYPTSAQERALARVFGCARVVYNDSLRLREECHKRGERISDAEVQRRVVTLAKFTPERAWLGEVASVALVQACQDARRAYRNWFDSLAGKRKGCKIGHPTFRRKHKWACATCGTTHDRDVNAARNILAAGRADRLNAYGGNVRPRSYLAAASELGTHRGAA